LWLAFFAAAFCRSKSTPRFTADQIQEALAPFERRLQDLERGASTFSKRRGVIRSR
jgi:hypothetical protein